MTTTTLNSYARCSSFSDNNIYLPSVEVHCSLRWLQERLASAGNIHFRNVPLRELVLEAEAERQRRIDAWKRECHRIGQIDRIYSLSSSKFLENPFSGKFLDILGRINSGCDATVTEYLRANFCVDDRFEIYQIPVLRLDFCEQLVTELDRLTRLAKENGVELAAPNTMNHYGVVLSEIAAYGEFLVDIRHKLERISALLWPALVPGPVGLDSVRAFTVDYAPEKDTQLALHYDNAEVTLNVCLMKHNDSRLW